MQTIKTRFNDLKERQPFLGDYIIACMVAVGNHYKPAEIAYLMKLVSDEEYSKSDKEDLLEYLTDLTGRG